MASTATNSLLVEKQGAADNDGTWGDKLNVGLDILDAAVAGVEAVSTTGGDTTLSDANYTADAAKKGILHVTGTLTSNATITVPNRSKHYIVRNATSGSYALTVKTSSGSGVEVSQGGVAIVGVDATANDTFVIVADVLASLASNANALGAALVGIEDSGGLITATTVEGALAENRTAIDAIEADHLTSASIGSVVQAYDADLDTWATLTPSANAQSLVTAANYAAMRGLLDLEVGTDFYSISAADAAFQPLSANLTTWAGIAPSANVQSLVTAVNYAAMRTLLDLEPGTDFYSISAADAAFQPLSASLTTWAGISPSADAQSLMSAANYAAMRALLDVESGVDFDPVGTDNSTNVTLVGAYDYLTIAGQVITLGQVDLTTDVSGALPVANGGTGSTTASAARTALGVDAAGTDNSTDVTLAAGRDYLTIAGQEITLGQVDLTTDVTGLLPAANIHADIARATGDVYTGAHDLGGADSLEIPNGATPTVDANGEIALDTTVTDWSHGIVKYYGGEEMAVLAVPIAQLTGMTNGQVISYNATNDELEFTTVAGSGDVTAASNFGTDNVLVKSDGTNKGVQATGITIADASNDVSGIGDITFAGELIHTGDTDNKIVFGTDTQDFQTGASSRFDVSSSGVRFGGTNARITTVLDQDDMSSDSATALATQQSIKAYVDTEKVEASSVAKHWARFVGTGTVTTNGSYNQSSLDDDGTGSYGCNFSNALANTNSPALVTSYSQYHGLGRVESTTETHVFTGNASHILADDGNTSVTTMGTLA